MFHCYADVNTRFRGCTALSNQNSRTILIFWGKLQVNSAIFGEFLFYIVQDTRSSRKTTHSETSANTQLRGEGFGIAPTLQSLLSESNSRAFEYCTSPLVPEVVTPLD